MMKAIEINGVMLSNGVFIKYDGLFKFVRLIDNNNDIYIGRIIDINEDEITLGNITKNDKVLNYDIDFYFNDLKDVKLLQ